MAQKNHCSLSLWSLSCLQYHWSLYSYSSSILLDWFKWHCSLLAPLIYLISWFCCQYQRKSIRSTPTSSRCFRRLCSMSFSFHSLHHSSQQTHLIHRSSVISMPMTLNSLSLFLPSTSRSTSLISNLSTFPVQSSLTYKTLQSQKPSYLYNLLNLQANLLFVHLLLLLFNVR